jgi:soluble lytic murein transglycosylase-like protein
MSGLSVRSDYSVSPNDFSTSGTGGMPQQQQLMQELLQEIEEIISELQDASDPDDNAPASPSAGPSPQQFNAQPGGSGPTGPAPAPGASGASASSGISGSGSTLGPGFPKQLEPFRQDIENASKQTGVPANILAAQIWQESRGDVGAGSTNVNGMTDQGLMQVDPATFASLQKEHPELQGKSLSDPATNIMAGAYYMADMGKQFGGDWNKALRAYNSGPDQVNPSNLSSVTVGDPNYVSTVTNFASIIEKGGQLPA